MEGIWVGTRHQGLEFIHERRTFAVTENQSRQGIRTRIAPKIERKSMGDTILSQTAVPWIRSRNIAFDVYRMKPRTRVYAFFDGVDITAYITPKVIELNKTGSNSNIINEVVTAPGANTFNQPSDSTIDNSNQIPFVVGETVVGIESGVKGGAAADDAYVTTPYGHRCCNITFIICI